MTPPLSDFKHIKHLGARPKRDQDNAYREKLCHYVRDIGCFYEIYPERFYLVYLAKGERTSSFYDAATCDPNCPFIIWSEIDSPTFVYESFNMDFGPFNLAVTHQFCSRVKVWLDTHPFRDPDKAVVVVIDDHNTERKLNTTLLVAIAGMVLFDLSDEDIIQRLNFFMMYKGKPGDVNKQLVFREKKKFSDVSGNQSLMVLTLDDCIRAFYAALDHKFYDYYEFDHVEYLFYETVMSGDLNWIVPGKILAFAGPCDSPGYYNKHPPSFYYHYFKDHNVSSIIRLNDREYASNQFTKMGFEHHDLIFPDGYPPTSPIAAKFIKIVDEAKGAVAVHCYAGIGRTGTLIAAYLIARFNFTPQMAVAWTRICRPGSVIGEQQDWLYAKFHNYSFTKETSQTPKQLKGRKAKVTSDVADSPSSPISSSNVKTCPPTPVTRQQSKTAYAVAEKTLGQAKALQLTKRQRESPDRPCTRSQPFPVKRASVDGDTSSSSNMEGGATSTSKSSSKLASDVILNLGKTVPLSMHLSSLVPLEGKRNPKHYIFEDGIYNWKVKFPEPGYVELRHNYKKDINLAKSRDLDPNHLVGEPNLEFRYEHDSTNLSSSTSSSSTATSAERTIEPDNLPRLKPIAYYTVLQDYG